MLYTSCFSSEKDRNFQFLLQQGFGSFCASVNHTPPFETRANFISGRWKPADKTEIARLGIWSL